MVSAFRSNSFPHDDAASADDADLATDDAASATDDTDLETDEPLLPDYYAQLGVAPDVNPEELRRAYHRLVKSWHPDRFVSALDPIRSRAGRRIRQLNEAYDTLSDPTARADYDRRRAGAGQPVGDVINVFGQRSSAWVMRDAADEAAHASANPNGAGQFAGALALVLALALLGGAVSGSGVGLAFVVLIAVAGVVALGVAATFFVTGSPLALWAQRFMEAEPAGATAATRQNPASHRPDAARSSAPDDTGEALFDALIAEALAGVPSSFDAYMRNVVVRAEDEPSAETLRQAGVPAGHTLLGLYHGVSLIRRGATDAGPEVISIYRGPIERYCGGDLERIRSQVRSTVLHELAHHFGIDHDEMPEWVK